MTIFEDLLEGLVLPPDIPTIAARRVAREPRSFAGGNPAGHPYFHPYNWPAHAKRGRHAVTQSPCSDGKSRHGPTLDGPRFGSYTIFEGTSEIQRLIISRAVSGVHIN